MAKKVVTDRNPPANSFLEQLTKQAGITREGLIKSGQELAPEVIKKFEAAAPTPYEGIGKYYPALKEDYYDGYDDYINPHITKGRAYSTGEMQQMRFENQTLGQELGNAVKSIGVNIAPQILSGFSSMLDIQGYWDAEHAANNSIVNWAADIKKKNGEEWNPIYTDPSGDSLDLTSSAWWASRGSGLVESIASFAAQGAGAGKLISMLGEGIRGITMAKNLANSALGIEKAGIAGTGIAKFTTAAMLNQSEAVIESAQVYNDIYKKGISANLDPEEAKQNAANAAATTMNLNRINILFNLSSASAFLNPAKLSRQIFKAPETLGHQLLKEGGQEAAEELINHVASKAGMARGENKKYNLDDALNDMGSMEGIEAAFLGALGGVGQTAVTHALRSSVKGPGNTVDENGNPISANTAAKLNYERQQEVIDNMKSNGVKINESLMNVKEAMLLHAKIAKAEQAGNIAEVEKLNEQLFETQAVKAFNSGTTEVLEDLYKAEAARDPKEVGEEYIARANQAIKDLTTLEKVYNNLEGYENREDIFFNRANKIKNDKAIGFLSNEEKLNSVELGDSVRQIAKKYSFKKDQEVLLKKEGEVVGTETNTIDVNLPYTLNNLQENTGLTEENKKTYDKFLKEVESLPAYKAQQVLQTNLDNKREDALTIEKQFGELTSPEFQEKVKEQKEKDTKITEAKATVAKSTSIEDLNKLKNQFEDKDLNKIIDARIKVLEELKNKEVNAKAVALIKQKVLERIRVATAEELEDIKTEIANLEISEGHKEELLGKVIDKQAQLDGKNTDQDILANFTQGKAEEESEVSNEQKAFATTIPEGIPNPKTEKKDVESQVEEAIAKVAQDASNVTGNDTQGNLIYNYARSAFGAIRAAYLSRAFNQKSEAGIISREEISNDIQNLQVLDPKKLTPGTKLTLRVDTTYKGEKYNHESETNEVFIWEAREKELLDIYGDNYRQSAEYINEVPIVVLGPDNQPVFYVHETGWINEKNIDNSAENIEADKELLHAIRKEVIAKGSVKTTVTFKGNGRLIKSVDGKNMPLISYNEDGSINMSKSAMPDTNLSLSIFQDNLYHGNTGKNIINADKGSKGRVYAMLPVTEKDVIAVPLERQPLEKRVITSIIKAVEAHLNDDTATIEAIADATGLDISSAEGTAGLRQYIANFTYLVKTDKNEGLEGLLARKTDKLQSNQHLLTITGNSIEFGRPGVAALVKSAKGTTTRVYTISANFEGTEKGKKSNRANLAILEGYLANMLSNVDKTSLITNNEVAFIDEEGNITSKNYKDFVKETHATNLLSVNIGTETEPNWVYTIQPTITFDDSFVPKESKTKTTVVKKETTVSINRENLTPAELAVLELFEPNLPINTQDSNIQQISSGRGDTAIILNKENNNVLIQNEYGDVAIAEVDTTSNITLDDLHDGAVLFFKNKGILQHITVTQAREFNINLNAGESGNDWEATWADLSSAYHEQGSGRMSKNELLTFLNKINAKKPKLKIGKIVPSISLWSTDESTNLIIDEELSTYNESPFVSTYLEGLTFNTLEGAFQAAKLKYSVYSSKKGELILDAEGLKILKKLQKATGKEALKIGRTISIDRSKWDTVSTQEMEILLIEALGQNKEAVSNLLNTGNATLKVSENFDTKWTKEYPLLLEKVRKLFRDQARQEVMSAAGTQFKLETASKKEQIKQTTLEEQEEVVLEDNDKIIFGHPGIGKSYLRKVESNIIDFDEDYKTKINEKYNLEEGFQARNKWRESNPKLWETEITQLWNLAKEEAKNTGKRLLASDMLLLKEFANDFDKVITMPKETFIERTKQRNDYTKGETESWKANLDKTIAKIPGNKIINTDKYLSDLMKTTPEEQVEEIAENTERDALENNDAIAIATNPDFTKEQLENTIESLEQGGKINGVDDNGEAIRVLKKALEIKKNQQIIKTDFSGQNIIITDTDIEPYSEDIWDDMDAEEMMPDFSPEQIKAQNEEIDSMVIRGLNPRTQESLISYLAAEITRASLDAKEKTGNATINTAPIFDNRKEVILSLIAQYKELNQPNKAQRFEMIIAQWAKVRALTGEQLSLLNTGAISEENVADDVNEAGLVRTIFSDDFTFTVDSKNTASADLKKFFSFIQDTDADGVLKYSKLGFPDIIPFDTVYNTLHEILANKVADFDTMMQYIKLYEENFPWLSSVMNELEKAPDKIKNEFVSDMAKNSLNMEFVMWSKDYNGAYSLRNWSSNSSAIENKLRSTWNSNLKGAFTQSNLVTTNEEGDYIFNPIVANTIIEQGKEWESNPPGKTKEDIALVAQWLGNFGIVLSDKSYNDLVKGKLKNKINLSWQQLFRNSNGLVNILNSQLELKMGIKVDDAELLSDTIVKSLARLEARNVTNIFSNSFQAGVKTVYSYTNNNYLVNRMRDLTAVDAEGNFVNQDLIDDLQSISFTSESLWLNDLTNKEDLGELMKDTLGVTTLSLEALKKEYTQSQDNRKLNNLVAAEHETTKIGKFFNASKNMINGKNRRVVSMFAPTFADKSTMMCVRTLAYQLPVDNQGNLTQEGIDLLYKSIVLPELHRMSGQKTNTIEGYEPNYFYLLPSLNNAEVTIDETTKTIREFVLDKRAFSPEVTAAIHEVIKNDFDSLVAEKLKDWDTLGIGVTNKNTKDINSFLDKSYMANVAKGVGKGKVRYAAQDYVFNSLISNAEYTKLFAGDPALFFKKSSKENATINDHIIETYINLGKRLAGDIAPGIELADSMNNKYFQVFFKDTKIASNNVTDKIAREFFESVVSTYADKKTGYGAIEGSDAQEYTTWQEHVYVLNKLGRLTQNQYNRVRSILEKGEELSYDDLQLVLQPLKPVYVGNIEEVDLNVDRRVYIKSSSFPLLPQLTKVFEIDKVRIALETFQEEYKDATGDGSPVTVRASFGTANKVGAIKASIEIFNTDGTVKDNLKITPENALLLPRSNFRIQQDVPYKREKSEGNIGTQARKLLFVNMLDVEIEPGVTGAQLQQEYDNAYNNLFEYKHDKLMEEFGLLSSEIKENFSELYEVSSESTIFDRIKVRDAQVEKATNPLSARKIKDGFEEAEGTLEARRADYINKNLDKIVKAFTKGKVNILFDDNTEFNKNCI